MDKLVEELEKNIETQKNDQNPIFSENPYTRIISTKKSEDQEKKNSGGLKKGNSTRYSNFYSEY